MNGNTEIAQRYILKREVDGEQEVIELTSDELMDFAETLWSEPEEEFSEDEESEIGCQRINYHMLEIGGEEKALEMLEAYEGYTILKLCGSKDIIVFDRDDLTAAGFDMSSLAGDSGKLEDFLGQKFGLPEDEYIIVESHGRLKRAVAVTRPKIYELLYWWYSGLAESKRKAIAKKLEYANANERFGRNGFDFDLLEEWREELTEVMATIGEFDTSNYSLALGIAFEDFIVKTKEYRKRVAKRKAKQKKQENDVWDVISVSAGTIHIVALSNDADDRIKVTLQELGFQKNGGEMIRYNEYYVDAVRLLDVIHAAESQGNIFIYPHTVKNLKVISERIQDGTICFR